MNSNGKIKSEKVQGWMYYNHAAVPMCAPHEKADITPVENGSIWTLNGKKPFLARWTTDFDCGYETGWWYVIKDEPFDIEKLDSKKRKHIRQALKKTTVKLINSEDYAEELCKVHNMVCANYKNFKHHVTPDYFKKKDDIDVWAAFSSETDELIGYMTCRKKQGYIETITAKYHTNYLNLRCSDAIHYTILNHYLNDLNYSYISSGSRNINHDTNVQEYKIKTFGFRKAYCNLHIEYNPKIYKLINVLYALRKVLRLFDWIKIVHMLNAILKMEEIKRNGEVI